MSDKPTINTDALVSALSQAKTQLDTAIGHMTTGPAASSLTSDQLSRLRALSDQNTSCQNSGCGGKDAAAALASTPAVAGRTG
ncbi:MAG TPA: hypothetical protein VHW71_17075 [Steroidobacteraceae bacterium]|jgi:hypothetical protein|nr:hypothetical protein [Steroidobacteraceae bacterium]